MWSYIILAISTYVLSTVTAQQQPPQEQSQCKTNFKNGFFTCISNFSLDPNEFISLINNQTRAGTPIGTDAVKDKACPIEKEFFQCGSEFMTKLQKSGVCDANSQAGGTPGEEYKAVLMQFLSLMGQFDFICAHPCRKDVLVNLRKCYTTAELDPNLFLSNATAGRGAVIGTKKEDVDQYCLHKDQLLSCMKDERDTCPDAPELLRGINLDIEAMEKGVGILCKHPKVYLSGLQCFANTTKGVEDCAEDQRVEMVNLMYKAANTSMEEAEYYKEFCRIRAKHVGCDLNQWRQKVHPMCNKGVIGLRTEMECGLLPEECKKLEKANLDRFHINIIHLIRLVRKSSEWAAIVQSSAYWRAERVTLVFAFSRIPPSFLYMTSDFIGLGVLQEKIKMWSYYILAICLYILGTITAQQQPNQPDTPQQQSQCRTNFKNGFFECITKYKLDPNEFMSLINNETRAGTPIGTDAAKDKACPIEKEFFQCGTDFMTKLQKSGVCDANSQAGGTPGEEYKAVLMQFLSLMGQFDFICAHPCRKDVLANLKKCYETADLDPDRFLSNETAGRGAVIGAKKEDVDQYCIHKDELLKCMKNERDTCPDAPELLRGINLDIEAMEKGCWYFMSTSRKVDVRMEEVRRPVRCTVLCRYSIHHIFSSMV
ncbi:hypothetical protein LOTGIDRAFT_228701 [Lottia gigantea]|uniref:DUF19 domain-containing protein n=1 Tax=Lottia gigantea TaxID=225164 RepID=V4BQH6_LOTGI|nr:hypothetical protein LOTGIDRAFT_228701 [Lottia gigantea]ESO91139.1 hypothetical protein LOTGIDRAFT_228701 [Lottia gigantea]